MKLTIEHETQYRLDHPAQHAIQYLHLTPRREACQTVLAWDITTPGALFEWTDGFGNLCHTSVLDAWHDEVVVAVAGVVETADTGGVLPLDDGLPPLLFTRETLETTAGPAVRDFAEGYRDRLGGDGPVPVLHALMEGIADAVTYSQGETSVGTDAETALARGAGVCQDHAHLFIACCRVLGLPARYVSGYILAGADNDSHLASHAWAEAQIEGLGWVSFDPANRQSATDAYVRLAVGFDYASTAPIRGVREGGGTEAMTVRVQINRHEEQEQAPGNGGADQ